MKTEEVRPVARFIEAAMEEGLEEKAAWRLFHLAFPHSTKGIFNMIWRELAA